MINLSGGTRRALSIKGDNGTLEVLVINIHGLVLHEVATLPAHSITDYFSTEGMGRGKSTFVTFPHLIS